MKFNEEYEEVLRIMAGIWGGDIVERQRDNLVLQILASVPFYAGSSNPMRVAVACINNYFLYACEGARKYFNHQPEDDCDLFSRISLLYIVPSGNQAVIDNGRILLELIMIQDHMTDSEADIRTGKYNPVVSGAWEYNRIRDELIKQAACMRTEGLDMDFPLDIVMNRGFWEGA